MKGKKGNFDTNYNVQAACGEDQVITFCNVTDQANDKHELIPALEGIAKNTNKTIKEMLADAGYGTYTNLAYIAANHIDGYIPYTDMNTDYEGHLFHYTHFEYHKEKDFHVCPAGEQLHFYKRSMDIRRGHEFKLYRTQRLDICKQCPFLQMCRSGKNTIRRVIKREKRQHLKEQMKQKLNSEQGQKMYHKRLHPIEAIFGHLKYNLGYTRFLLRGLPKVKAEFTLMCLTYNLRKLIAKLTHFLMILWILLLEIVIRKYNQYVIPKLSMNFCKHFKYNQHVSTYRF